MNYRFYNYFVEGDCEKHLIRQNQQLKNQYFLVEGLKHLIFLIN